VSLQSLAPGKVTTDLAMHQKLRTGLGDHPGYTPHVVWHSWYFTFTPLNQLSIFTFFTTDYVCAMWTY